MSSCIFIITSPAAVTVASGTAAAYSASTASCSFTVGSRRTPTATSALAASDAGIVITQTRSRREPVADAPHGLEVPRM